MRHNIQFGAAVSRFFFFFFEEENSQTFGINVKQSIFAFQYTGLFQFNFFFFFFFFFDLSTSVRFCVVVVFQSAKNVLVL